MDTSTKTIGFMGHLITRKWAPHNAYIHYEYTVTGPLFEKPFMTNNMKLARGEVRSRANNNSERHQKYLTQMTGVQRCLQSLTTHQNCIMAYVATVGKNPTRLPRKASVSTA